MTTIDTTLDSKTNIKNIAAFAEANYGILRYIFVDLDDCYVTNSGLGSSDYYNVYKVIASNQKDHPVGSFFDINGGIYNFDVFKNMDWGGFYQQFLESYAEYLL